MKEYIVRFLNFNPKYSTTRTACLVMMGCGALKVVQGELVDGVALWALASAVWGVRDKQDNQH